MSSRDYLTIGEVVQRLSPAYPDLSVSKLRFLEDEGLIAPERTPGGYRKFSKPDVGRVEVILKLQRDHFYPLAVIKEKLGLADQGVMTPEVEAVAKETTEHVNLASAPTASLALKDSLSAIQIPESFVRELHGFGIITLGNGAAGHYIEAIDISSVRAAWDLRKFGVEPRHLRMYATFADKESALYEQILVPTYRHKTPESRKRLNDSLSEISSLTDKLKGRLLRKSLAEKLEDLM